jgi:prepilin-type N-terminal cleavage/methylation domain-containing protein
MSFALPKTSKTKVYIPKRFRGFSLLEVLIAAFILAFGILSIAGLQISSLRRAQDAAFQAIAINQVNNILAQFSVGDFDCSVWKVQSAALLPHADLRCNRKSVTLCWQGKNADKQCVKSK